MAVVKVIIGCGQVGPDTKDGHGWTLLSWAEVNSQDAVVKVLRDSGRFHSESKGKGGWALRSSAQEGEDEAIRLPRYSRKDHLDIENMSEKQWCLWWAAEVGHEPVVTKLLESGSVDPGAKDKNRRTLLWWAANNGHADVIEVLLGSSRFDSAEPLDIGAENGHAAVVKVLLDSDRVNPNAQYAGWTPLYAAKNKGHVAVVEVLESGWVDANAQDTGREQSDWTQTVKNIDEISY